MKIIIVPVGKERDFSANDLVGEYSLRIGHYMPIEWKYIPASTSADEASKIHKLIDEYDSGTHVMVLDEKGKEYSSLEFAGFMQKRLNEGVRTLIILIGGAYGFDQSVRERATSMLALSRLTFPHQLVRLILAEQLYRVCTIIKGEKYHH
jgi:23S rRNA (pseudouridine1915-N3)-methyltransferase